MWRFGIALALAACGLEPGMGDWDTNFVQNTAVIRTGGFTTECPADLTGTIRSNMIPVTPGHPYRAAVGLRHKGGAVAGQDDMRAYVEWFTTAEVTISTTDVFAMGILAAQNTWYDYDVIADAPATAGFCQLVWDVDGSANSVAHFKDRFTIDEFPHAFAAYPTAIQNVAAGAATKVTFGTEEYDHGSIFGGSTCTIPMTGVYTISGLLLLYHNGAPNLNFLTMWYDFNAGTTVYFGMENSATVVNTVGAFHFWVAPHSWTGKLSAGDTIEIYIGHDDAANVVVQTESRFSVTKVE